MSETDAAAPTPSEAPSLRDLSVLARWSEIGFIDRKQMQAYSDFLFDQIDARVSGGVGHAPGLAVNRRERTSDGRTILGWNPDGFIDDSVPTIRIDALDGTAIDALGPVPLPVGHGLETAQARALEPTLQAAAAAVLQLGAHDLLQHHVGSHPPSRNAGDEVVELFGGVHEPQAAQLTRQIHRRRRGACGGRAHRIPPVDVG